MCEMCWQTPCAWGCPNASDDVGDIGYLDDLDDDYGDDFYEEEDEE